MAEFRLKTVLFVAQEREDNARKALEKALSAQQQADAQLQQLHDYRDDYQQRQRSGVSLTPLQWQGYQDFLIRIQQAIDIQIHICEQAQKTTDIARQHYFKQQRFLKGIELLKEKHEKAELQQQERVEQKLLDEFAMRRFKRNS